MRKTVLFVIIFASIWFLFSSFAFGEEPGLNLMPVPAKVTFKEGKFPVTLEFTAGVQAGKAHGTHRVKGALRRTLNRLAGRTGFFFKDNVIKVNDDAPKAALTVQFERIGKLKVGEDESYRLEINTGGIQLTAPTDMGILRGLETLLQLLNADSGGYYFPASVIEDKPRFQWRGLLIDSCRHFFPVEVIKRNLDGMAAVKMNVLHWHLSEDQGFRVECKTFPRLHQLGSDGMYYTHEQIKDIIAYAADRGIRVVPEFDIPGHSTSWLVGYPEYASAPGPYSIERGFGVKDPTFDPTLKKTYKFFDKFFKEMTALFPDEYMHIGGDENNGKQWNGNTKIQQYMKKKGIKDNHQLQAEFNKKILRILAKYKKKMVGWDEIFQPYLPKSIVIHSWRGKEALGVAARKGYQGILSNGYYIDLCQTTEYHYLNDPIPADSDLTQEERRRILGGEATMWAELISPETIDSRIWPRTAAIAERLWSPGKVKDVADMYRRMDIISLQLEELGLTHIKNQAMMLRRLTGGKDIHPLKILVDVMEPLKIYKRHNEGVTYTVFSPLTRLVDAALPDARKARNFNNLTDAFIKNPKCEKTAGLLLKNLKLWQSNHERLLSTIQSSPVLKEIETLSADLSKIAGIAIHAIELIKEGKQPCNQFLEDSKKALEAAKKPRGHAELMIVSPIQKLIDRSRQ